MYATQVLERVDTVIIGGGQSGLSVGYFLKQCGIPFVVLEAKERIGDSWRQRWDSLRLFTPARFDGLAGMPFPAPPNSFPTKDEMADYLEAYAARFELPVRTGMPVERLWKEKGRYLIAAGDSLFEAEHVVVAMANYQAPKLPPFAGDLSPDITQVHSNNYRNLSELRPGGVLVVGAGNSGAEIAIECARAGRATWLSGRDVGHVPFRTESKITQRVVLPVLFRFVFHRLLTVDTRIGRKARSGVMTGGAPLIRQRPSDLARAGVERVTRVTGVRDGKPLLADGRVVDAANVIWCTGFTPGLSWIELPMLDERGEPIHERGLVPSEPGLFFVGQHFLYSMSSAMIHGVARDAERIARAVAVSASQASARPSRASAMPSSRRRVSHDGLGPIASSHERV
jgi:putative flavoprotein involved in K+ transport